jgi:hypothetical protein
MTTPKPEQDRNEKQPPCIPRRRVAGGLGAARQQMLVKEKA